MAKMAYGVCHFCKQPLDERPTLAMSPRHQMVFIHRACAPAQTAVEMLERSIVERVAYRRFAIAFPPCNGIPPP